MRKTILGGLGAALLLAAGPGCSATRLTSSWSAPAAAAPQPLHRVLVVSLARDEGLRRIAEEDLARRMGEQGVEVRRSSEFVQNGAQLDPDTVKGLVERTGVDAVLITELLGVENEPRYVPGYMGWYGYYGSAWPYMYSGGYYTVDQVVHVSTKLFSARPDGQLLWSTLSETLNPSSPRQAMASVSKAVVKRLDKIGLI